MKPKVFIGSSVAGLKVAQAIYNYFAHSNIADINIWKDGTFRLSQTTFTELIKAIDEYDFAIFIFLPEDPIEIQGDTFLSVRDNVIFETGLFLGKLGNQRVFGLRPKYVKNLRIPTDLSSVTLGSYDDTKDLDRGVSTFCSGIEKIFETFAVNKNQIENSISKLNSLLSRVDATKITANDVYSTIVNKYFTDIITISSGIENKFQIVAENYPYFILELQEKLNARTKSIALHNHFERFWSTPLGNEIRHTASNESQRIFVYKSEQDFEYDFANLMQHSKGYLVYILSYETLSNRFPDYAKDFAIIISGNYSIHAEYNLSKHRKTIDFTINDQNTKQHEESFDLIVRMAIQFDRNNDIDSFEEIKRRVFDYPKKDLSGIKLSNYEKRTIEMSKNINIFEYEKHEEEHAFYIEMLECMISKINKKDSIRILETGAGTGLLTKRLAKLNNVTLVAIEYDWNCFKRLEHNLKPFENVSLFHEDSRIYNPDGDFDIVISSFSDHHIKPQDKFSYLTNMKDNLKENGLFIVGDEFLRDYNPNNDEDYVTALTEYHNYIINVAESKGQKVLASLEKMALISGINKIGDFKVSNNIYEFHLKEAGLKFSKELIGPKDITNIGGIYVYTITK